MHTLHTKRKSLLIAGAGQFGRSAAALMNTEEYTLAALADNSPKLQNTVFLHPTEGEIPIVSMEQGLRTQPDAVLTGVIDEERTQELIRQIRTLGYTGEVLTLRDHYLQLDIRSAVLIRMAVRIREMDVPGAAAELGVYRGDLARKLNALFPDRPLFLFDTFEGFASEDVTVEKDCSFSAASKGDFSDTSMELVRSRLPFPEQAVFKKGFFPDTARGLEEETYALVSLDADLYAPLLAGLRYFWPRLSRGGMILLHDYGNKRFRGAFQAVQDFEKEQGYLPLVPLCDLHGTAVLVKP